MQGALVFMNLHVDALFTHDEHGRIVRSNEPDGALAPRFFLGLTKGGFVRRYRYDLDGQTVSALESAFENVSNDDEFAISKCVAKCSAILATSAAIERSSAGPAYSFPNNIDPTDDSVVLVTEANQHILLTYLPAWLPDVTLSAPLFARVVDNHAVAVCGSVRITPSAHEAGVETAKEFRGQGYAMEVVSAWARSLKTSSIEPLYSTSWENLASQAVARKLGLIEFGHDVQIT